MPGDTALLCAVIDALDVRIVDLLGERERRAWKIGDLKGVEPICRPLRRARLLREVIEAGRATGGFADCVRPRKDLH